MVKTLLIALYGSVALYAVTWLAAAALRLA